MPSRRKLRSTDLVFAQYNGVSLLRNGYMLMSMRYLWLGAVLWTTLAQFAIAQTSSGPITFERIQNSNREPQNWLTYSGNNMGQRYSPLTQVTPQNVKYLEMAWLWQARSVEKFEATSIVLDGILYTIQAPNDVVALDAATGRLRWTYVYRNLPEARNCCGQVNRGLAILGETLFMGTLDANLIALDTKSGALLWKTKVAEAKERYAITHAPLVVKDKVILGTAGGDRARPESSPRSMRRRARRCGASIRFRNPVSPVTKPGAAIRGNGAARRYGTPAHTILN